MVIMFIVVHYEDVPQVGLCSLYLLWSVSVIIIDKIIMFIVVHYEDVPQVGLCSLYLLWSVSVIIIDMVIMFIVVHYEGNTSGGFMYLVFTRMPGESYRMRLRPMLLFM